MNIMNSNCSIPNWNLIQQRQEQAQEEGDNHVSSMLDDRMREFIWENEQPPEFSFGGIGSRRSRGGFDNNNMATTSCDDTLESIVDQAIKNGFHRHKNITTELAQNEPVSAELLVMKKRVKSSSFSESGDEKYPSCSIGNTKKMEYDHREEVAARSTCDTTTTMILNVKTIEEDSATCHAASENLDSENQRKEETGRSHQTRSSRAAAIHKQSERKRRDRINQKLKALQKLVPDACKTDKASMLDEVIEYMKQLKAQVNLMMNSRNAHDQMLMMMLMPSLGMQQQLQMSSLLARMATSTTSASPLPPPPPPHHHQSCIPFLHPGMMISRQVPPAVAPPTIIDTPRILKGSSWRANLAAAAISNSLPYNEYYSRFLAQSMNMELYNNMRALCTHQEADTSQRTSSHQEVNHAQRQL